MLANMGYAAVALQTGAAFLQVAAPMTADGAIWGKQAEIIATSPVWSDRAYRFNFIAMASVPLVVDEKQSGTLHNALIASFDEFIAPIAIS
jgi:hypothetical protein